MSSLVFFYYFIVINCGPLISDWSSNNQIEYDNEFSLYDSTQEEVCNQDFIDTSSMHGTKRTIPDGFDDNDNFKHPHLDPFECFKNLHLSRFDSFGEFEETLIEFGTKSCQECDLELLIKSLEPGLRIDNCCQSEIHLLHILFPLLHPTGPVKNRLYAYFTIYSSINRILVNFLNFFSSSEYYNRFSFEMYDVKNYFAYKETNRYLYQMLLIRRDLNRKAMVSFLEENEYDQATLFEQLDDCLKSKNLNLSKLYSIFQRFRKRRGRKFTKKFFLFSAIRTLEDIDLYRHVISSFKGIFISLLADLDSTFANQYLFYFVSLARSMHLSDFATFEIKKVIIDNAALIYDRLIMRKSQISTRGINEDFSKLKKCIKSLQTDRNAFIGLKYLFLDYSYFMLHCDLKILKFHNEALLNADKFANQVDLIYFGLFNELDDIFLQILQIN